MDVRPTHPEPPPSRTLAPAVAGALLFVVALVCAAWLVTAPGAEDADPGGADTPGVGAGRAAAGVDSGAADPPVVGAGRPAAGVDPDAHDGQAAASGRLAAGADDPDLAAPPESAPAVAQSRTRPEPVPAPGSTAYVPVLLVPGWLDTERDLAALRLSLLGYGWPDASVESVSFEEPTGSNRRHAEELDSAVQALLAASGAEHIDIVAHSMGGLATRWYLLTRPDAPVRRVVFIASPHRGTLSAHLAWGGSRAEMMPDSPFLDSLNSAAPVPVGVELVTIRTTVDTHIVPGESATLPGVSDHELCCPTHAGLLHDDEVFRIVRAFLRDGLPDA